MYEYIHVSSDDLDSRSSIGLWVYAGVTMRQYTPIRIDTRIAYEKTFHVDVVGIVQKLLGESWSVVSAYASSVGWPPQNSEQ